MSTDVTVRLNNLKAQIEQGKTEKAKAEATLESYTRQREEIVKELAVLGVVPENLDAEIAKLDREIIDSLNQAESLLGVGTC